ncbi:hypothetical protein ACFO4N_07390 [Camelliibacillus cellulosilyticus]|uniref:Uncharacterized protein n=1 Tax=Camelliibacillus cellulosilyticus TaxID=2174486 RepID=A0ABV9GNN0_9BACL
MAHGINALNAYDGDGDDVLYKRSYAKRLAEMRKQQPKLFDAFSAFDSQAMKPGLLNRTDRGRRRSCHRLPLLY